MPIPARISIVTLGVSDLARSSEFYAALGWRKSDASQDAIAWFHTADSVLGLFATEDLARDANADPRHHPGFRGVTLAINLESPEAVDQAMAAAVAAGATVQKPATAADWGGYSGYFADPDGHLWELAHNPFFPLTKEGRLDLP